MKNLIIFLLCSFSLVNSFSKCLEKSINPNSKYEFVDNLLDTLISIQSNETEIYENRTSQMMNVLYVYKKSVIDTDCSIQNLRLFEQSSKVKIKEKIPEMLDYLNSRNNYQREVIRLLTSKNIDFSQIDDKFSDLKIEKDEIEKKLNSVIFSVLTGTRFEESDNPNFRFEKISKEKRNNYLGVTTSERVTILKKIGENFGNENSNMRIVRGLYVVINYLTFDNKELISLEKIK